MDAKGSALPRRTLQFQLSLMLVNNDVIAYGQALSSSFANIPNVHHQLIYIGLQAANLCLELL